MGDVVAEGGLPVADPREAECRLWAAFGRGILVDLRVGDPEADDPAHADSWDESRRVRAEVVVALLLGAVDPVAGYVPKIRLAGALVEGSLDVRQGIVGCAAELTGCRFADMLLLGEARTRTLDFSGSVLEIVDATAAEIGGHLILDRCQARAISVELARITGRVSLNGAHLINPDATALNAEGMTVDGGMSWQAGFRAEGEVRLVGAHISGALMLDGAHLINPDATALNAGRMIVDGSMFCQAGFRAEGEIRLIVVHISGRLRLNGAHLINPGATALNAEGMTVDGGMSWQAGFRAEGEVRLVGAHVSGQLSFRGAILSSPGRTAMECETLEADSLWLDGVTVTGTVSLMSARVRVLHDDPSGWPGQMLLDGFAYDDLRPYTAAGRHGQSGRLSWLANAEADYRAQPYEQLAAYDMVRDNDRGTVVT